MKSICQKYLASPSISLAPFDLIRRLAVFKKEAAFGTGNHTAFTAILFKMAKELTASKMFRFQTWRN